MNDLNIEYLENAVFLSSQGYRIVDGLQQSLEKEIDYYFSKYKNLGFIYTDYVCDDIVIYLSGLKIPEYSLLIPPQIFDISKMTTIHDTAIKLLNTGHYFVHIPTPYISN